MPAVSFANLAVKFDIALYHNSSAPDFEAFLPLMEAFGRVAPEIELRARETLREQLELKARARAA